MALFRRYLRAGSLKLPPFGRLESFSLARLQPSFGSGRSSQVRSPLLRHLAGWILSRTHLLLLLRLASRILSRTRSLHLLRLASWILSRTRLPHPCQSRNLQACRQFGGVVMEGVETC